MKPWKLFCSGLILAAGLAPAVMAQGLPAITPPPGLAIAPQPPPVNAPAPPAALPPNIWDKITPRADQCAACKAKICNSPIGQMLNNMLRPVGALSGGMAGPCCPTINAADLAKPADSAEGAAARLKLDEADAKARREAIRYMAGADCRYWPEVTDALIGALRSDRNECVRFEAALALNRGCCCSRATMKALTLTVSGSQEDGNPAEDSERVKEAALAALNHCLANYTEVVAVPEAVKTPVEPIKEPVPPRVEPIPTKPPEASVPAILNKPVSATEFYHHPENLQEKKVVEGARRAAEHLTATASSTPSVAGDHTVLGILRNAMVAPAAQGVADKSISPGPVAPAFWQAANKSTVAPAFAPTPSTSTPVPAATSVSPASFVAPAAKTVSVPLSVGTPASLPLKPMVPAATTVGTANTAAIINTIGTLRDSIYPEERERAAQGLGGCDALSNPNAVQALVDAARSDSAPIVRAACLHSLVRMNVRTLPVATVAQDLKTDSDPRVRSEAVQALQQLSETASSKRAQ